jgi:hypothetical protein
VKPKVLGYNAAVGARGLVQMPQLNGKQEDALARAQSNLRCPRNGKWMNRPIPLPSPPLSVRAWEGIGSRSTSPDTGQRDIGTLARRLPPNTVGEDGKANPEWYQP